MRSCCDVGRTRTPSRVVPDSAATFLTRRVTSRASDRWRKPLIGASARKDPMPRRSASRRTSASGACARAVTSRVSLMAARGKYRFGPSRTLSSTRAAGRSDVSDMVSVVLETEPDLEPDLEVLDGAVLDLAAHLRHLEPVHVAQGEGGPLDGVADGLVDAVRRGADDLGDAVRAVGHRRTPWVLAGRGWWTRQECHVGRRSGPGPGGGRTGPT